MGKSVRDSPSSMRYAACRYRKNVTWTAFLITLVLCSITITVLPASTRRL
jgi:hypothetical protein